MLCRNRFVFLMFIMAGCSTHKSVINNSFDDLVNETRSTKTSFVNYKSYVSISGLVPHAAAGTLIHHPDSLSPTHGLGLSPKWSYVIESTFPMDSGNTATDFEKLKSIRNKYIEARGAIVKATALQVKASLADSALVIAKSSKDLGNCKLVSRILSLEEPKTKCEDADLTAMGAALADTKSKATSAVEAAALKRKELIQEVDKKNILVTRWDQQVELTSLGKLADFFSLSVDHKKEMGGVLIAGDLRVWSLKVGEDYIDMVREMDPQARLFFQQVGIDLFLIHAKHRLYIAEMKLEDAVAASLSLTVADLRNIKSVLNSSDRLELGFGMAMLSDISNIGALSAPAHNVRRRCFIPPVENEKSAQREFLLAQGYHPVYEVRGQMTKLDELARIETELSMHLANVSGRKDRDEKIINFKKCADAGVATVQ